MAIVVFQACQGYYHVDYGGRICKQSAEQLSHVTERERLAQEAVRESQDPGRDVNHVSDVSMPDPGSPETPNENAETTNDDCGNTAEPVPHSSSSHWEWRPEYEVPLPEPGDPVATRPELFPLTGEELSEHVFEILIDLFASPGSERCEDSRGSEHCEDSHVSAYCEDSRGSEYCEDSRFLEAHVYTQDRDRFRPLKRRVEVPMRNLSREDRDAFKRATQKASTSWLDKEAVELVKDPLKVPRSHILRARWVMTWKNVGTEKVLKARLCALGFQDFRFTTLPTSSPTLTSDGESVILQWIVNEGHLLESEDLITAFLSGDPDPANKGSDALYIDPPPDLKRLLKLGTEDVLRLRKAVYGLVNAPLRWHQKPSRAL